MSNFDNSRQSSSGSSRTVMAVLMLAISFAEFVLPTYFLILQLSTERTEFLGLILAMPKWVLMTPGILGLAVVLVTLLDVIRRRETPKALRR